MESMVSPGSTDWAGRRVFITGHTGFKGSWLALWLQQLGAEIHGYALDPPTKPSLFNTANVSQTLASDIRHDLADRNALQAALVSSQPEVVFHLAAQPLVRDSYVNPVETWATNLMGTAHLLEAIRTTPSVRAVVLVTTDKVYDNREWPWPYRENDTLGGKDPYSASKTAAELLAASYRASFFNGKTGNPKRIATARAGNVVGGGDWGRDRLVPDCIAAFSENRAVELRYPQSIRPWQHVLEPLAGYLRLAECLLGADGAQYAQSWNFGPNVGGGDAAVHEVAQLAARFWGDGARVELKPSCDDPPEAGLLRLDSMAARSALGWKPRWPLTTAIEQTIAWHKALARKKDMPAFSNMQIQAYENASGDA